MKNNILLLIIIISIIAFHFYLLKKEETRLLAEQNELIKSFLPNVAFADKFINIDEIVSETRPIIGFKTYDS